MYEAFHEGDPSCLDDAKLSVEKQRLLADLVPLVGEEEPAVVASQLIEPLVGEEEPAVAASQLIVPLVGEEEPGEEEPTVVVLEHQLHKASGHGGYSQAARAVSASPLELHKRAPDCLDDDVKLLMDESGLHTCHGSSLVPAEAWEGASFDHEETSAWLGAVCGDEHSSQKPSSADFGNISALDEYGQHVDKIEECNQEEGRTGGRVPALLHLDDDTLQEKFSYCYNQLTYDAREHRPYCPEYEEHQHRPFCAEYGEHELKELYERLAMYRIRGYELSVDGKLAKLDDASLKLLYTPSKLYDECYFGYYEKSLEWYFDRELCQGDQFDDYQRLVLRDYFDFIDWESYRSTLNTYQQDLEYVQYCEAIANETKWIEDYPVDSALQWRRINDVAYIQALEIAAGFPSLSAIVASNGFREHMRCVTIDCSKKGLDGVYFEIWKRVAKGKMNFEEALIEVHGENMFPSCSSEIEHELEKTPWRFPLKDNYDAHVACIDETVSEDKARQLIREAIKKMIYKPKFYVDYAKMKINIAKDIGLIPQG